MKILPSSAVAIDKELSLADIVADYGAFVIALMDDQAHLPGRTHLERRR